MKIEIISDILDDLEPNSLFMLSGVPTDQKSFEELAQCSTSTGVTWADVEAKYELHESKFATAEMRTQRDALLKESDVEVLPDRTPSDEIKAYRQALRDLPSTEVPTYNANGELQVSWPIKP
tara:strand:- start:1854 stop:2219 length:366 start_codon:yes stop_codon:yes gene_type:complete